MEVPQAVAAELKSLKDEIVGPFNEKIVALDKKADEQWAALKANPDALLGESLKKIVDERAKETDKRTDAVEKALTEHVDEIEAKAKERGEKGASDPDASLNTALAPWFGEDKSARKFDPYVQGSKGFLDLPAEKVVQTITTALMAEVPGFRPGIYTYPQAPLSMRDLVMPGTIGGYNFSYERELAGSMEGDADYQGGANPAEGVAKPTMDIYTEIVEETVSTIAVTSRVSQQVFDDRQAFISFLRGRMAYRVLRALDRDILNGAGTTGEIEGINTVATAYDGSLDAAVEALQQVDIIRTARLQVELNDYVPDGVVLHPTNWANIELLKDADERYLFSNATSGAPQRLWGMRVVTTTGQTANEFTVGDFRGASQLFMRQELRVLASTEDQDNFVKNLVTLRAELRGLLAIYSTLAFVTSDFTTAAAAT